MMTYFMESLCLRMKTTLKKSELRDGQNETEFLKHCFPRSSQPKGKDLVPGIVSFVSQYLLNTSPLICY